MHATVLDLLSNDIFQVHWLLGLFGAASVVIHVIVSLCLSGSKEVLVIIINAMVLLANLGQCLKYLLLNITRYVAIILQQ